MGMSPLAPHPLLAVSVSQANTDVTRRFLYITYSGENTFGDFEAV